MMALRRITRRTAFFSLLTVAVAMGLLLGGAGASSQNGLKQPCVLIYYDRSKDPADYWIGRTYAMFAQNLLGHFPEWQQIVSPIELYRPGEIETCEATLYLGSYFENAIPEVFYEDFAKTEKRVMWLGYSVWRYPQQKLAELFGYEYEGLTELDTNRKDEKGRPTFFKDVLYKGEVFPKFGEYVQIDPAIWRSKSEFRAGFEQVRMKPAEDGELTRGVQVLAQTRHSGTGEVIPYVLRKENRFFVADVPFSFMHESDRMLVFADLLFDLLNEKPRHNGRYATIRIEDIHPMLPLYDLEKTFQALRDEEVPIVVSLIPIFFDPLHRSERPAHEEFVPMDRHKTFMSLIRGLKREGATFIWHGVTHQYDRVQNPHDGMSGSNFEFWNAIGSKPVKEDSPEWVLNRLEEGWFTLRKAGIDPVIWLTPHYQASTIDYAIFARVFPWNIGRVIYYNHRLKGLPQGIAQDALHFDPRKPANAQARKTHLGKISADIEFDRWNGQIFPYEIYGDVHGQRLIPENLGNSQPFVSAHVMQPRSVQEIIADAKRNLVLRDAWASLFYHTFLLGTIEVGGRGAFPGDPTELKYIVRELKKLGYQFIDLDKWARANVRPIRPEPIVRDTLEIK
ncbi:MAG: DUF2334 domain-containing protein [Bdellovibrionales bacterium]|jgi:uncharacterized protein YdaL|nr:DUF2334 domain-containing protein [Bdellovibrionales bacterium]